MLNPYPRGGLYIHRASSIPTGAGCYQRWASWLWQKISQKTDLGESPVHLQATKPETCGEKVWSLPGPAGLPRSEAEGSHLPGPKAWFRGPPWPVVDPFASG